MNFLSQVNSLTLCGPQVDTLIYCKRLKYRTLVLISMLLRGAWTESDPGHLTGMWCWCASQVEHIHPSDLIPKKGQKKCPSAQNTGQLMDIWTTVTEAVSSNPTAPPFLRCCCKKATRKSGVAQWLGQLLVGILTIFRPG